MRGERLAASARDAALSDRLWRRPSRSRPCASECRKRRGRAGRHLRSSTRRANPRFALATRTGAQRRGSAPCPPPYSQAPTILRGLNPHARRRLEQCAPWDSRRRSLLLQQALPPAQPGRSLPRPRPTKPRSTNRRWVFHAVCATAWGRPRPARAPDPPATTTATKLMKRLLGRAHGFVESSVQGVARSCCNFRHCR